MKKWIVAVIALLMILQSGMAFAAGNDHGNYIASFEDRYQKYAAKHPETPYSDVLIAVNLKLDEGNYKNILTTSRPDTLDVLVSKHYALPKKYKPENLVSVDRKYAQSGVTLREDCYRAFLSMAQDMEKEGLTLYIKSGYRTNRKRGDANSGWYAWPGHSEHQTGLAFDLRKKNVTYETMWEYKYHKTDEYAWLCENAYQYGFILSYPEDTFHITGINYEPWHWRYIGVEIATDMRDKGFKTYHEYWAAYKIQNALGDYGTTPNPTPAPTAQPSSAPIQNAWIASKRIPAALGKLTLTEEAAAALVGQAPDLIAKRITTLPDALLYLKKANMQNEDPFVGTPVYGKGDGAGSWVFANTGKVCIERNEFCCCGGAANVLCYLLAGDYDEVGQIRWLGGGNHTVTYVKTGGYHYVFDLTAYASLAYKNENEPITKISSLSLYWKQFPTQYKKMAQQNGSEVTFMFSYACDGAAYPWNLNGRADRVSSIIFPTGAKVNVIYSADNAFDVTYEQVKQNIPGWN